MHRLLGPALQGVDAPTHARFVQTRTACAQRLQTDFLRLRRPNNPAFTPTLAAALLQEAEDWNSVICARQFGDIQTNHTLTFVDDMRFNCGLGSRFHRLSSALLAATEELSTVLVLSARPRWPFAEGPACTASGSFGSHECFFQPLTSASLASHSKFPISENFARALHGAQQRAYWSRPNGFCGRKGAPDCVFSRQSLGFFSHVQPHHTFVPTLRHPPQLHLFHHARNLRPSAKTSTPSEVRPMCFEVAQALFFILYLLLTTYYLLPTTLLTTYYLLRTTYYLLFTTYYLPFPAYYLLLTTYYFTTYYLLLTTDYLLFTTY